MTARHRSHRRTLAAALAALTLTACAGGNDDAAARFLVAPGRYALFNCKQLAQQAAVNVERQRELEGLMAQAGTGSGGRLVSSVAYRPEYLTLRGELSDMRQTAVDKKCDFVPGEDPGATAASSRAIR
jgi:hypothetical protein